MSVRSLPALLAISLCAIWPQGVVLCAGEEGHVEFELAGAPCCPDEPETCDDCSDHVLPDVHGAPAAPVTPPLRAVPRPVDPGARFGATRPEADHPPFAETLLRSVVIVV